jgi:hypothetical protein
MRVSADNRNRCQCIPLKPKPKEKRIRRLHRLEAGFGLAENLWCLSLDDDGRRVVQT